MERVPKIVLLAAISIAAVVGLSAVAYAQTARASQPGQCESMMSAGSMGMMSGNNGMMGQSGNMQANCQSMMSQNNMGQCQNMASQNLAQCQEMMTEQNSTQPCH